jgi:hypothetical protein
MNILNDTVGLKVFEPKMGAINVLNGKLCTFLEIHSFFFFSYNPPIKPKFGNITEL